VRRKALEESFKQVAFQFIGLILTRERETMLDLPIFQNVDKGLLKKFEKYHKENRAVFLGFTRLAIKMKSAGHSKYSHVTIIEALRWSIDIKGGKPFKINNDFKALYARLMIHYWPHFEGFFSLRKMKPEDRRDSQEEIYRSQQGNTL